MTCPCPHDKSKLKDCCCTEDCKSVCTIYNEAEFREANLAQKLATDYSGSTEQPQGTPGILIPPGTILKSVTVFQYLQGDPSLVVAEEMMDGTVWAYATTKSGNQRVLNYQNMKTLLDTMPANWSKMYHREVREEFNPKP